MAEQIQTITVAEARAKMADRFHNAAAFRVVLTDPDGNGTSVVPAEQVEAYIAKGFTEPKVKKAIDG